MINHESNNPSEKTRLVSGEAQSYSISNQWVLDDDGNLPSYRTLTKLELSSDEDGALDVIQLRSEDDSMRIMIVDPRSKPTQTDRTGSQVLRADVPAVIGRGARTFCLSTQYCI